MNIKIEIKSIFGSVLFSFEKENNTIKDTLLEAIKANANLRSANLSSANLSYADLSSADLSYADLSYADLSSADLRSANLRSANLRSANLSYANLSSADLSSANLRSADLRSADLRSAKGSELAIAMTRILPEGDLIGYKKCEGDVIVKLLIPADAKRSSAFGRKCRCEFAKVLEIYKDGLIEVRSNFTRSFTYKLGEIVKPEFDFSEDWMSECESGIHFYITRLEAENN